MFSNVLSIFLEIPGTIGSYDKPHEFLYFQIKMYANIVFFKLLGLQRALLYFGIDVYYKLWLEEMRD